MNNNRRHFNFHIFSIGGKSMTLASAKRGWAILSFFMLLAPSWAVAQIMFDRIVVFGTSLSDPGNAFALTKQISAPPYDTLDQFLIPDAPYARDGHHFSNGATWIEQFARALGLAQNTRPAFQGTHVLATNYAVGGARARDDGININLSDQINAFLSDFSGVAPSDALYVVEMGVNDIHDALVETDSTLITAALTTIDSNLRALYVAGARKFLIVNAPNLRLLPAIQILNAFSPGAAQAAELLTRSFNSALDSTIGLIAELPEIEIARLDVFQELNDLVVNPEAFGLKQVKTPCITPNLPPFACRRPDKFLFWDGIHPTKAVHAIFAQETVRALAKQENAKSACMRDKYSHLIGILGLACL
jgi:phospholipase/lecithinase/hemolysin